MAEHARFYAAVFPIILRDGQLLLHLRQNTGYMDDQWDFGGSGHIEDDETAAQAVCRECSEELGLVIRPEDVRHAHICHRVSRSGGRTYFDCYFFVDRYEGVPRIGEPDKCAALGWFPVDLLPEGIIPIRRRHLARALAGIPYSEEFVD